MRVKGQREKGKKGRDRQKGTDTQTEGGEGEGCVCCCCMLLPRTLSLLICTRALASLSPLCSDIQQNNTHKKGEKQKLACQPTNHS